MLSAGPDRSASLGSHRGFFHLSDRLGGEVDCDRYCVDVLTQVAAVRSAFDAHLITEDIVGCLVGHGTSSEHRCANAMMQQELVAEAQTTLRFFQMPPDGLVERFVW